MKYIQYCTTCLLPGTKPDLSIDQEGVCAACRNFEARKNIDWQARKQELQTILKRYRAKGSSNYDCIVPVSGGKDSHYQVIRALELGLTPLCVTATTDHLSDLGRRNIENLKDLGVDYIEVTTNPVVRRKINKFTLTKVGDISWPEHVAVFTIPVRLARQLMVPLILWGENSQNEYGGPAAAAENNQLNRRWLEEFGGLLGLRVSDILEEVKGIKPGDLLQYTYPSDEELKRAGVTGLFLGYYFSWDGFGNALVSQGYGFETFPRAVEGSLVNYENLDNAQTGIHDYFKFLKYGFGRATDQASLHIRRGRISREDGAELVRRHDGRFPWTYLNVSIEEILERIDMTLEEFIEVCDRFTNKRLFLCDQKGNLQKDRSGNLTKINFDNV